MRTIQEQLIEKRLSDARIQEKEISNTKISKRPKEKLTDRDWTEIMGTNRDVFRRVRGGAIRIR